MVTAPGSMETAFREAVAAVDGGAVLGVDMGADDLDLFRDERGRLPKDVFRRARQAEREARGRGRPAGATNKRNKKLAQLICSQSGDPVLFLASVYARPLDQLVELMQVADGSAEREEQLFALLGEVSQFVGAALALAKQGMVDAKIVIELVKGIDRLTAAAADLKSKPGELAVKALAAQINAAKEVGPYVHGKQPISVEVRGKADMVLLIPGLNAPSNIPHAELQAAVEQHGIAAIDFDNMTLIDHAPIADDDDADGDE